MKKKIKFKKYSIKLTVSKHFLFSSFFDSGRVVNFQGVEGGENSS